MVKTPIVLTISGPGIGTDLRFLHSSYSFAILIDASSITGFTCTPADRNTSIKLARRLETYGCVREICPFAACPSPINRNKRTTAASCQSRSSGNQEICFAAQASASN